MLRLPLSNSSICTLSNKSSGQIHLPYMENKQPSIEELHISYLAMHIQHLFNQPSSCQINPLRTGGRKLRLYKHKLSVDQRCSALDVLHENAHVSATHVVTLCCKMGENLIVKLLEGHKCVISRRTAILDSLGEIFGSTSVAKNSVNARVVRCHVKVPL